MRGLRITKSGQIAIASLARLAVSHTTEAFAIGQAVRMMPDGRSGSPIATGWSRYSG